MIMRNSQSSQDIVRRMNMLLDNELSKDAERELLNEIKSNPGYRELLSKERSFRDFIKSRVHRKKVSPAIIQSIKEKINKSAPV